MNASLHENQLICYQQTYTGQKMLEITGESVVPDKLPDIGLIGDTNTHIFLRSKRVQSGSGIMEGDMCAGVCYIPDGASGLCVLEINIPWQVEFGSELIRDDAVAIGHVSLGGLETRMLNPRKVLVKVQLQVQFSCFEKGSAVVCDGVDEDVRLQVCRKETDCSVIATVCEKTFVASDEYPLPGDLTGGEILHKSVQFRVDDVKTLANKLIVKGSTLSDVVIAAENGNAEKVSFTSSFSFIAETDCEALSSDVKVCIMPTALYLDLTSGSGTVLNMEVHGVCQIVAYTKQTLLYLSDAYSNYCDCRLEYRPVTVFCDMKSGLQRESVSGEIACRGQASRILFMTAAMTAPTRSENRVQIPVQISACVQYESGASDWVKQQEMVTLTLKDTEQLIGVRLGDLHGITTPRGIEYRLTLDGEVREERLESLQTLSAVELDEESPCRKERPSLTVVRSGGSLWELARRFGSTVSLIRQYNQLEEDDVEDERILLIPKQRL